MRRVVCEVVVRVQVGQDTPAPKAAVLHSGIELDSITPVAFRWAAVPGGEQFWAFC